MPVTVDLASADEIEVLVNLWQLYMKELAEFRDFEVQADGRYRDDRLRTYLAYEEHWPLLIRSQGEIAGFALVRKSKPTTYVIGEFFIKLEFRRFGVGGSAVAEILPKFMGNWEIPVQIENSGGAAFWRKIVAELGYEVTEVNSLASDDSDLPQSFWLSFTNSKT